MLRIHFLQHWFKLAGETFENALYDSAAFCKFARFELRSERARDATTLLNFRRRQPSLCTALTAANMHDSQVFPELMYGNERRLYGELAYRGEK